MTTTEIPEPFDKDAYRKRRAQGKRGQDDAEQLVFEPNSGEHGAFVPGKGIVMVNRQRFRRKVVDRTYTRKGYGYGKKV